VILQSRDLTDTFLKKSGVEFPKIETEAGQAQITGPRLPNFQY
jgi:hypothetical protein